MKIFLSGLDNARDTKRNGSKHAVELLVENGVQMRWNLMSFFYMRTKKGLPEYVRDHSEEIMIDSGAHSFQKGTHVDWDKWTEEYSDFIRRFDQPKVRGYFEMDVDNVIGFDKVLQLRRRLETVTDKIIPVWHKNRGIDGFKQMCEEYAGKIVAVTGFKNEDIQDHQYLMFLKYAHSKGCKVHCLGMTRKEILDRVPFDFTDSTSWAHNVLYGKIRNRKVTVQYSSEERGKAYVQSYIEAKERQEYYYKKWQHICRD